MLEIRAARRLAAKIVKPFASSKEKRVLYHVTRTPFDKFRRPDQGVFFSTGAIIRPGSNHIIPVYLDVRKYRPMDEDVAEMIFNREYEGLGPIFQEWIKEGFDAMIYGSDNKGGQWIVVFNPKTKIKNAETGAAM